MKKSAVLTMLISSLAAFLIVRGGVYVQKQGAFDECVSGSGVVKVVDAKVECSYEVKVVKP